jgi:tetratricopeptide (TPR) repeat protein
MGILDIFSSKGSGDINDVKKLVDEGNRLERQKKDSAALKCYNKALAIDPNNVVALSNKGAVLANMGDHLNAFKSFNRALELKPNDRNASINKKMLIDHIVENNLAEGHYFSGKENFSKAKKYYDNVLEVDPNNIEALNGKAMSLLNSNNPKPALPYLNKALKLDNQNPVLHANIGYTFKAIGSHKEAIESFNTAINICSKKNPNSYVKEGYEITNQGLINDLRKEIQEIK